MLGTLAILACAASDAGDGPVAIDELSYVAALQHDRPDLFEGDCWNTVTVRPRYRAAVLGAGVTWRQLLAQYGPDARAADLAWIRANQAAELDSCAREPTPGCARICRSACDACTDASFDGPFVRGAIEPSGYPLCGAVGYRVGERPAGVYDPAGVVESWKVFFTFVDGKRPSPATMDEYSRRLAARGYRGDWKMNATSDTPEMLRFQYNNLILHGWAPTDAVIAEEVGLDLFRGTLEAYGRGLDVGSPPHAKNATDWHHFLCMGDLSSLSDEALTFVGFGKRPEVNLTPVTGTLRPLAEYRDDPMDGFVVSWAPDLEPTLRGHVAEALHAELASIAAKAPGTAGVRIAVAAHTGTLRAIPNRGIVGVHRSAGWLTAHGFDAAREGVVEIYDAGEWLTRGDGLVDAITVAVSVTHPERCAEVAAALETECPK